MLGSLSGAGTRGKGSSRARLKPPPGSLGPGPLRPHEPPALPVADLPDPHHQACSLGPRDLSTAPSTFPDCSAPPPPDRPLHTCLLPPALPPQPSCWERGSHPFLWVLCGLFFHGPAVAGAQDGASALFMLHPQAQLAPPPTALAPTSDPNPARPDPAPLMLGPHSDIRHGQPTHLPPRLTASCHAALSTGPHVPLIPHSRDGGPSAAASLHLWNWASAWHSRPSPMDVHCCPDHQAPDPSEVGLASPAMLPALHDHAQDPVPRALWLPLHRRGQPAQPAPPRSPCPSPSTDAQGSSVPAHLPQRRLGQKKGL